MKEISRDSDYINLEKTEFAHQLLLKVGLDNIDVSKNSKKFTNLHGIEIPNKQSLHVNDIGSTQGFTGVIKKKKQQDLFEERSVLDFILEGNVTIATKSVFKTEVQT